MSHRTESVNSGRQWGIRSLATGSVYSWATSQQAAEFMWAGTGAPDRYEVVRCCGGEWVTEPSATLPPIPGFAVGPLHDRFGDDEIVRMAICLTDPLYGKKVEPPVFSAAEIRYIAEQRKGSSRIGQRLRRLAWWRPTS